MFRRSKIPMALATIHLNRNPALSWLCRILLEVYIRAINVFYVYWLLDLYEPPCAPMPSPGRFPLTSLCNLRCTDLMFGPPINVTSMASCKMICRLATTMHGACLSISEDAMLCHAIDFNQFSRAKSLLRRYMTTSEAVPSYLSRL